MKAALALLCSRWLLVSALGHGEETELGSPWETHPQVVLENVLINGEPTPVAHDGSQRLLIGPGLHRIDFDFCYYKGREHALARLRCRLAGNDDRWLTVSNGMTLVCQVRDRKNGVISETRFNSTENSKGWRGQLEQSEFVARSEPIFIPQEGHALYIALSSGSPDTLGIFAIKNLQVGLPDPELPPLWSNGEFTQGTDLRSPQGTPTRWTRRGSDERIARLTRLGEEIALTLVDDSAQHSGDWASRQRFDAEIFAGKTVVFSWEEAHDVVGSHIYRASYLNVQPGDYTFQAIGMTAEPSPTTASLELAVRVLPPFWRRPWFLPLVVASSVAALIWGLVSRSRRQAYQRLREYRFQRDLERDRARIARDMHDDLGTRISVLSLHGAMALKDLDDNPENSRRLLSLMKASGRELVVAMDDLVWAVDPAYDNLEQFGTHLTRMAEEIFRESAIRCRLEIPALLPAHPLSSDFRYQLALAVKEALHNVLRHAGACDVKLTLDFEKEELFIQIQDSGCGFQENPESDRHGLANLKQRLQDLGGTCTITSTLGEGTLVEFRCPLSPHVPPLKS